MTTEIQHLKRDQEVAHLRTEVATSVLPLFDDMVEQADERLLVLDDMVAVWLHLPPSFREHYESVAGGRAGAAVMCAEEYAELVDRMLPECDPQAAGLRDGEHDVAMRRHWRRHVAEIRTRQARGAPPPAWLLARFPVPDMPPAGTGLTST